MSTRYAERRKTSQGPTPGDAAVVGGKGRTDGQTPWTNPGGTGNQGPTHGLIEALRTKETHNYKLLLIGCYGPIDFDRMQGCLPTVMASERVPTGGVPPGPYGSGLDC